MGTFLKIGLHLDLKKPILNIQLDTKVQITFNKLWNALPADQRDNYLKSYAIFVNRLKQFLRSNQL